MQVHIHSCVRERKQQGEATSDNQRRKRETEWREKTRMDHKKQSSNSNAEKERTDREIKQERKETKHYLFWRLPSPPRSSEKFLRFHQHQLDHKEKTQPHQHWQKEREIERETEGGTQTESDSPIFSRLLLMATNLIICLHSGAAEICSLTYTPALAHSPSLTLLRLTLSSLSLFLSPSPQTRTSPPPL